MADHKIDIQFSGSGSGMGTGGTDSSLQFLASILTKLNTTLDKLTTASNKGVPGGSTSQPPKFSPYDINNQPFKSITNDFSKAVNDFSKDLENTFKDLGKKVGSTLTTSVMAAVGVTAYRLISNETNAIMGRAQTTGQFGAASIQGNANQQFGNYIGNLFDIEKNRQIQHNSAEAEGIGGGIGGAVSSIGTIIKGIPVIGGVGRLIEKGGLALGAAGAATGGYAAAKLANAQIEQQMAIRSALAQRDAMASVSEWKTGFSRFGLSRTNHQIAGSNITGGAPISASLSDAFQQKYGQSQNYNAILNNITPYLQSSPLDNKQTGDLNKTSQNFLKAGFAAQDFARLTIQASQYQALTGKNIQGFSEDIKQARSKFGDVFDSSASQNQINLMAMGYNKNQAQNMAFQAQYNPSILGSGNQFMSQSIPDWYKNQAIGKIVGFDINKSLQTGHIAGASKGTEKELNKELQAFQNGVDPLSLPKLTLLMGSGVMNPSKLAELTRKQIEPLSNTVNEKSSLSPAQSMGQDIVNTIQNGLTNVNTMNVTAQSINITGNINTSHNTQRNEGGAVMTMPPNAHTASHSAGK
jgi:hypothetical protein